MSMIDDLKKEFVELSKTVKIIQGEIDQLTSKIDPFHVRLKQIAQTLECLNELAQTYQESYGTLRLEIGTGGGEQYEAAFKSFESETGLSNPIDEGVQEDSEESEPLPPTG